MRLVSTRGNVSPVTATQAFIQGIASDGGLFVPEQYPKVNRRFLQKLVPMNYQERAARVLGLYLECEYSQMQIESCIDGAYTGKFPSAVAPLRKVGDTHVLELFRGPTCAFKDMALQLFPRFLPLAFQKESFNDSILILVATSGDTGAAAMDGFSGVSGTRVLVYYPQGGVSRAQRLQMVAQSGENVAAAAVVGNFDDAQTGVKRLFSNAEFIASQKEKGVVLSSANSINFGRLLPQVVYYFSAYADLCGSEEIKPGDAVDFCVPTGNFGNILAGWYALQMGLPIGRLICASNRNNVLTDFLSSNVYDANRPFFKTSSPSMDILISSNLERLLFDICDRDSSRIRQWMGGLSTDGKYIVSDVESAKLKEVFAGGWADDDAVAETIRNVYVERQYLMDPHTAVAWKVGAEHRQSGNPLVVISTADPYKFPRDVLRAIDKETAVPEDDFAAAETLERRTDVPIPATLKNLPSLEERHKSVFEISDMAKAADVVFGSK